MLFLDHPFLSLSKSLIQIGDATFWSQLEISNQYKPFIDEHHDLSMIKVFEISVYILIMKSNHYINMN